MLIGNLNSVRFQFVAEARNASLFSTRSFIADGEIDEIIFFMSQLLFSCIFPEENFKTIATGS